MEFGKIVMKGSSIYYAPCEAYAAASGDKSNATQEATYFFMAGDTGERWEGVAFGCAASCPEEALELVDEASSDYEDLATVVFPDGSLPRDYLLA